MSCLVLFRRDLRTFDHHALLEAAKLSTSLYPVFILDPRQLSSPYRSEASVFFMIHSLRELDEDLKKRGLKLHLFYGIAEEVLEQLLESSFFTHLFFNKDYTPFSRQRDQKIKELAEKKNVLVKSFDDALLIAPSAIQNLQNKPYTVFTPFYRKALGFAIEKPKPLPQGILKASFAFEQEKNLNDLEKLCKLQPVSPLVKGGRKEALHLLKELPRFEHYHETRNFPALYGTTRLSAHHKFGTVSIREVYWAIRELFGPHHDLIRELFWRDFYTHILFHFPDVLGHSFIQKYDSIPWENDEKKFETWKNGQTGFPIVDAGMRELNQTGWMHNRVRMITASFLVKDLHIDWRKGEQYFAQKLVDYDPAVNNGSWQWAASTGCDAQPYFRIFNPWMQQKRFDPEALYIKKWVLELKEVPLKEIHTWSGNLLYPAPIVDHAKQSQKAKELYAKVNHP